MLLSAADDRYETRAPPAAAGLPMAGRYQARRRPSNRLFSVPLKLDAMLEQRYSESRDAGTGSQARVRRGGHVRPGHPHGKMRAGMRAKAALLVAPRRIEVTDFPLPATIKEDGVVRIESTGFA